MMIRNTSGNHRRDKYITLPLPSRTAFNEREKERGTAPSVATAGEKEEHLDAGTGPRQ